MNEIVKVTIPVNVLMELLRREAELESIKKHLEIEMAADTTKYIDKSVVERICSLKETDAWKDKEVVF